MTHVKSNTNLLEGAYLEAKLQLENIVGIAEIQVTIVVCLD